MHKSLLIISSALLMMLALPATSSGMVMRMEMGVAEQVEPERQIAISMADNNVSVSGAVGTTLEVVSLTGRHVASYKVDSPAQRIELNLPKGCYILKVGKVVRKVTLH